MTRSMCGLLVSAVILLLLAPACNEDKTDPSNCFEIWIDIMVKDLECFAEVCDERDDPSDAFDQQCDCAKNGEGFYVYMEDADNGGTADPEYRCLAMPDNDYDWCVAGMIQGYTDWDGVVTETIMEQIEDQCDCLVNQDGYYGLPTDADEADDFECFDDRETYCFETHDSSAGYSRCMCRAQKWSKDNAFENKVFDDDTQECRTVNACEAEYPGLKKWLDDGECEDQGEGMASFVFKKEDDDDDPQAGGVDDWEGDYGDEWEDDYGDATGGSDCNTSCSCSCSCGTAEVSAISGCLDDCATECDDACADMCG